MNSIYTQKQNLFLDAAISCGATTDLISRKMLINIRKQTGQRLPRWLMKDASRRRSRGLYYCPEIPIRHDEVNAAHVANVTHTEAFDRIMDKSMEKTNVAMS
jgi:hypothetical protein